MPEDPQELAAAVAELRQEVATLRAELDELRRYISEVPSMECGITEFPEWKREQEQ